MLQSSQPWTCRGLIMQKTIWRLYIVPSFKTAASAHDTKTALLIQGVLDSLPSSCYWQLKAESSDYISSFSGPFFHFKLLCAAALRVWGSVPGPNYFNRVFAASQHKRSHAAVAVLEISSFCYLILFLGWAECSSHWYKLEALNTIQVSLPGVVLKHMYFYMPNTLEKAESGLQGWVG